MESEIDKKIESILFWRSEPTKISFLAKILNISDFEVKESIEILKEKLHGRGIQVMTNEDSVNLVTCSENSALIESLQKEELQKDLSKSTLETLSVILYRGPIKRSDIDYIRGVNSQFTLRNLLVRGLINKKYDPNDDRSYVYSVTDECLSYLGVLDKKNLPEYDKVNTDIDNFLNIEIDKHE